MVRSLSGGKCQSKTVELDGSFGYSQHQWGIQRGFAGPPPPPPPPIFKYLMEMRKFGLSETKLFHFHGILKKNLIKSAKQTPTPLYIWNPFQKSWIRLWTYFGVEKQQNQFWITHSYLEAWVTGPKPKLGVPLFRVYIQQKYSIKITWTHLPCAPIMVHTWLSILWWIDGEPKNYRRIHQL